MADDQAAPERPRAAAVTGAGGSLGRALVRALRSAGWTVAGLVRNDADAEAVRQLGARSVAGDVRDEASLVALMDGASVVHHLAAWGGGAGGRQRAFEVNVEGTRAVLRAAAAAGARRVVLASSIAVYGPVAHGEVDEERALRGVGDPYGDSKLEAERAARAEAEARGIELVILRPTMIYGPGSPSWTLGPFRAIARGLPAVIGDGHDLLDAVYLDDVARAFVRAGEVEGVAGEAFNVGGTAATWNDFFGAYARMAGVPLRRMPSRLVSAAARVAATVTRPVLGRPVVVPDLLVTMTSRATFPGDKARRLLGYVPEVDLAEGMRRTEAGLREAGLLRRPRVALVTGAASGLGSAVARRLLERGLVVYAADVDGAALATLEPLGARTLELDVTSQASVDQSLERVEAEEGGVDLLVNAAGLLRPGPLETQPMSDVAHQLDVNALGPLRLARAVAPGMRRRGFGRILNVSSTNGFLVTPFMGAYSASKFALEALSDALRLELAPWGVEVGVLTPGSMHTAFADRAKASLRHEIDREREWSGHLQAFLDGSLWGASTASPPDVVARRVVRMALGRRLPARRFGTLDALPTRLFAFLPDRLKDAFFARATGLVRRRRHQPGRRVRGPRQGGGG